MNMSCSEKMTDREKEAFIGGIEQAENAGYSDAGDGFMNIPDGVDGELPFM